MYSRKCRQNLGLVNNFLDMTSKVQVIKKKEIDKLYFKVKNFCASKYIIKIVKRQPTEWKKIFAHHICV